MEIRADIRKFIDIPAKSKVVVCIRLPTRDSLIITKTVRRAVMNAERVTPNNKKSIPKTIANAAPKLAPEDTPRI